MNKCVSCTQVYADIKRKETQKPIEGIKSQSAMLLNEISDRLLYHEAKITITGVKLT
jgi:hypothetical protein